MIRLRINENDKFTLNDGTEKVFGDGKRYNPDLLTFRLFGIASKNQITFNVARDESNEFVKRVNKEALEQLKDIPIKEIIMDDGTKMVFQDPSNNLEFLMLGDDSVDHMERVSFNDLSEGDDLVCFMKLNYDWGIKNIKEINIYNNRDEGTTPELKQYYNSLIESFSDFMIKTEGQGIIVNGFYVL